MESDDKKTDTVTNITLLPSSAYESQSLLTDKHQPDRDSERTGQQHWSDMDFQTVEIIELPSSGLSNLDMLASLSSGHQSTDIPIETIYEVADPSTITSYYEVDTASSSKQEVSLKADRDILSLLPGAEPTHQYLTGKISFQTFSEMMEAVEQGRSTNDAATETYIDNVMDCDDTTLTVAEDVTEITLEDTLEETKSEDKSSRKKIRKKKKRRVADLPRHLEGMMGEANIKYAQGDEQKAISICLDLIKMAPEAYLPFQTLGHIYEDKGDVTRALQFGLIAAYLNPSDSSEWVRLAEMSLGLNDKQQAVKCYTKAIKADPQNMTLHWSRCKLYEDLGEKKKTLDGYKAMMKIVPPKDGDRYMELARNITKSYFEMDDKESAMETMKNAFQSNSENVTSEDVNLLMELLISNRSFVASIETLVNHCGIVFQLDIGREWSKEVSINLNLIEDRRIKITSVAIPELLPIDLRVKLGICLIHLNLNVIAKVVIEPLFEECIEDVGDLYLDVAEAYMDENCFTEARPILQRLVWSENYNLAAIWLRLAECLNSIGELEQAVDAYSQVVKMAPSHVGARMSLSTLQQHLGKHEEALEALNRDESDALLTKQEKSLLMHKCMLLHSQGKYDDFLYTCKSLLFNMFKDLTDPDFHKAVYCFRSVKVKTEILQEHLKPGIKDPMKSDLPIDDLWDLFIKLSEILLNHKKYEDLLEVTSLGMSCPYFMADPRKLKQAEFMCLLACLLSRKEQFAFSFVRDLCIKEGNKTQVWNLMSQVLLISTESRHNRFCLRYLLNNPEHVPIELLNGHNAAISGTYKYALGEYVAVLRNCPDDPLVNLCIGLTFVHLAGQKFSAKKHSLLTQGLAFLNNYTELRGECQETYYNMGRALHQLGLTYAAVHYYKKGLTLPPVVKDEENRFDLTGELAYNLMLIYKNSGSEELARQVIHQYLVI